MEVTAVTGEPGLPTLHPVSGLPMLATDLDIEITPVYLMRLGQPGVRHETVRVTVTTCVMSEDPAPEGAVVTSQALVAECAAALCDPGTPYATWYEVRAADSVPGLVWLTAHVTMPAPAFKALDPADGTCCTIDDIAVAAHEPLYLAWCVLDAARAAGEPTMPTREVAAAVNLVRRGYHWHAALHAARTRNDGAPSKVRQSRH